MGGLDLSSRINWTDSLTMSATFSKRYQFETLKPAYLNFSTLCNKYLLFDNEVLHLNNMKMKKFHVITLKETKEPQLKLHWKLRIL